MKLNHVRLVEHSRAAWPRQARRSRFLDNRPSGLPEAQEGSIVMRRLMPFAVP